MDILLVDDHVATVRAMRWLLANKGHRVVAAYTLAGARAACESDRFDLILCDVGLPDGDGREMAAVARRCGTRAAAVTGFDPQDADGGTAGFWAYLVKPTSLEAVDALLDRATAELANGGPPLTGGVAQLPSVRGPVLA